MKPWQTRQPLTWWNVYSDSASASKADSVDVIGPVDAAGGSVDFISALVTAKVGSSLSSELQAPVNNRIINNPIVNSWLTEKILSKEFSIFWRHSDKII